MRVSGTPTSGVIPSTPVAWATSHLLVIATGRILRTYAIDSSSSSRSPLAVLEGHTATITIVISLPGMRIASAGEDGTVRIWDVVTGQSLRIFDLAHPVLHMAYVPPEQLLCLTSNALLHVRLARDRSKRRHQLVRKLLSDVLSMPTRVVVSATASIIAVSDATKIHLTGIGAGGVTTTLRGRRVVTALAITRDGKLLAAADESGVISLYSNPQSLVGTKRRFVPREKAAPTQLHWHAAAPQALAFAHDDSVLLSAGCEAVLVTWRLTPALFGTRTFLPRLRSAIFAVSVSPDERTYAISQSDNAIRLVDQLSSDVIRTIRAVPTRLLDFSDQNPKALLSPRVNPQYVETCSVARDPVHHGKLWFAGAGPSLQLFDAFNGSLVDEIQIIPRNTIFQGARMDKNVNGPSSATVPGLAVHPGGHYLATVDYQDMHALRSQRYGTDTAIHTLKIWRRETSDQSFVLDAVIPQPHGSDFSVSCLCFHPKLPLLATASGASKTFKLWRATRISGESRTGWRSEIELDYRGMDCNGVCFSSDGSLLVVACEHVLTMWQMEDKLSDALNDTETSHRSVSVEFLHALVHPPAEERIVSVAFVFKSVPLLIAVTRNGIYIWHALSQSIWWSTRIRTESHKLAVDPDSGRFAVQLVIPSIGTEGENNEKEPLKQTLTGDTTNGMSAAEDATANSLGRIPKENTAMECNLSVAQEQKDSTGQIEESGPYARGTDGKPGPLACIDAAVAIYDASSPVPLHIRRLATGATAAALSFVKHPGQTNRSRSTLVCVDSRMEVFLYDTGYDTPFPPSVRVPADEPRSEKMQPVGNLEMILGEEIGGYEVFTESRAKKVPVSHRYNSLSPAVDKAFRIHFHGLTHVQAPVAVKSFDFVNSLLMDNQEGRSNQPEVTLAIDIPETRDIESSDCNNKHGLAKKGGTPIVKPAQTGESPQDPDSKAIRAFCVSIIRKANTKAISAT